MQVVPRIMHNSNEKSLEIQSFCNRLITSPTSWQEGSRKLGDASMPMNTSFCEQGRDVLKERNKRGVR